jgi:hemerythrin
VYGNLLRYYLSVDQTQYCSIRPFCRLRSASRHQTSAARLAFVISRQEEFRMSSINDLQWTDALLLGYLPMDDTHREFVETVGAMLAAPDEDFAGCLDAFLAHADAHFSQEREWMVSTGFPATDCHVDEHNAVLKSVHEVKEILARGGDVAIGRSLAKELCRWFPGHADYMDAPLAQWMVKKRLGGAPIVLKRGVANSDIT